MDHEATKKQQQEIVEFIATVANEEGFAEPEVPDDEQLRRDMKEMLEAVRKPRDTLPATTMSRDMLTEMLRQEQLRERETIVAALMKWADDYPTDSAERLRWALQEAAVKIGQGLHLEQL